ncbi:hypothetical protein [Marimonas lutisalis]|uniref:hypothetical protein n=1 Tax=Marimonas lutisalis TaxID=2545756 RepID=UPI0010F4F60D|nr:hypothetical protein [Marimonas lutisalis]
MRKSFTLLLVATLTLTACGSIRDSRLNPFNWFGGSRAEAVPEGEANPLIPKRGGGLFARRPAAPYAGIPVDTIETLAIERVTGGAIVRVTGVSARQGAYEVRLVEDEDDGDEATLTYTLRALYPARSRVGAKTSREVTAARHLTTEDLEGIRNIRVRGVRNARVSSRRF